METLGSILIKFDKNITNDGTSVVVGGEIIFDWKIPLLVLLNYGSSIRVYNRNRLTINVKCYKSDENQIFKEFYVDLQVSKNDFAKNLKDKLLFEIDCHLETVFELQSVSIIFENKTVTKDDQILLEHLLDNPDIKVTAKAFDHSFFK